MSKKCWESLQGDTCADLLAVAVLSPCPPDIVTAIRVHGHKRGLLPAVMRHDASCSCLFVSIVGRGWPLDIGFLEP